MGDGIADWKKKKLGQTLADFVKRHDYPFLLRQRASRTMPVAADADAGTEGDAARVAWETSVVDVDEAPRARRLAGARVVPVLKAPGSPYPERISLGRAKNCDIVIQDPSVSKLHAYFTFQGGHWHIVDVGSRNGTRINAEKLARGVARRVTPGDTVIFGNIPAQFLDARRLYEIL